MASKASLGILSRLLSAPALVGALLCTIAPAEADATNVRFNPPPPVFVRLIFDGDPDFPDIGTTQDLSGGLTAFVYEFTPSQRQQAVALIRDFLEDRYRSFNVQFVTEAPTSNNLFTWGIDDRTLVGVSCEGVVLGNRIFGFAGGHLCNGEPKFLRAARTFAGSFRHSSSLPPLTFARGFNVEQMSQAFANSAAHEIGHLLGLEHPSCDNQACVNTLIMRAATEAIEAHNAKIFAEAEQETLRDNVGPRHSYNFAVNGAAVDRQSGLMWTREGRLTSRISVAGVTPRADGTVTHSEARTFARQLDFLGYDDWRLPSALNPDGTGPCTGTDCIGSEFGRRQLTQFRSDPFATSEAGLFWMNSAIAILPWTFQLSDSRQTRATVARAHVWPVRGGRLIDNGDGTVSDPVNRLMWLRDPTVLPALSLADAHQSVDDLEFADHDDWRLPRALSADDRTCSAPRELLIGFPERTTITWEEDCWRNELAFLHEGWGVTPVDGAPFTLSEGGWYWLDSPQPGALVESPAYSLDGGLLIENPVETRRLVFPVRTISPNELPRGTRSIIEPVQDLVLRFSNVARSSAVSVTTLPPAPGRGTLFTVRTPASFESVEVCIRYGRDRLVGAESDFRVIKDGAVLDALPGYPDTVHDVVCGRSTSLGSFTVR